MHESEVKRIRREIWLLALANHDMRLVASTAQRLQQEEQSLVLEAGVVAIYCRTFSREPKDDRKPKHIVDELAWTGPLHAKLWQIRNKLIGHSDEGYEHRRRAVDVFGDHNYRVEFKHLNPEQLFPIEAWARHLAVLFEEAQKAREQMLRDAKVTPEPYDWS